MQIINVVVGEQSIRTLTMPYLKMFVNAEWNTFIKFVQKEVYNHHVEAIFNQICQFFHDGFTLVFGMQFSDRMFRHNNVLALSFSKALSSKYDKFSKLAEDTCAEVLDKDFFDIFASLVKDLATSKVVPELNVKK